MVHSLRKLMHPRNKYTKPPNFKNLAILYPEFRNIVFTDVAGNVRVNFKDPESLRVLTKTLLLHDFNLRVEIPPDKLVPTLSLRLNYVLWIEDLMKYASFENSESITGIDIGTGAVCIYPILIVKLCNYRMIATEIDETSVKTAIENIERNNLQDSIQVVTVRKETIFKDVVKEDQTYHFSMCNPPFFKHDEISRVKKQPPNNAATGQENELMVSGGEKEFVIKMIDESVEIKEKVSIFTSMLGKRSNLNAIKQVLEERGIENKTWTEFCQGNTKRWGIAWTFLSKSVLDLTKAPVIRGKGESLGSNKPIEIIFPPREEYSNSKDVVRLLKELPNELDIELKELNFEGCEENTWTCELLAKQDTWSHARRRRRMKQRTMNVDDDKKEKDEDIDENEQKVEQLKDPWLVCSLGVVEENFNNCIKICLLYERGEGGKNALETFRHYLINKLNIREYISQKSLKKSTNESKKKKKKKKTRHKRIKLQVDTTDSTV